MGAAPSSTEGRARRALGLEALGSDPTSARGLITILADTLLMWGGFFLVVPLIAVRYVDGLGWAAASVGLVLAARQLVQQGLTVVGGALADRYGARSLILAGLLVRVIGFSALAWATSFPALLGALVLGGLGGALFEAPRSAAIAALTEPADRPRFYALAGVLGNLGMTLGVLAGSVLVGVDFAVVALASGACYLVAFALSWAFLPQVRVASGAPGAGSGLALALGDRRFLGFLGLLAGYWFLTTQLSLSVSLEARRLSGTTAAVGWVFALNAVLSVALQYPVIRAAERRLRPLGALALGVLLMGAGLGLVALASGTAWLLACVALFTLGGLLAAPSQQAVTARLADPAALGSYFGVAGLSVAVGGGAGNLAAGLMLDWARAAGVPAAPWLAFAAVGSATALGLRRLDLREHRARPAGGRDARAG